MSIAFLFGPEGPPTRGELAPQQCWLLSPSTTALLSSFAQLSTLFLSLVNLMLLDKKCALRLA
jgi:hypothetical protein